MIRFLTAGLAIATPPPAIPTMLGMLVALLLSFAAVIDGSESSNPAAAAARDAFALPRSDVWIRACRVSSSERENRFSHL